MKGRRSTLCVLIEGNRLPRPAVALARRRAEEILRRSLTSPLRDIVAAAYLLGVEDCADALEHAERTAP